MTFSATRTDLTFLVVEIYQHACQQNPHEMLTAQKCEISENTVVKLTEDFNVTCPVACAHKLNTKISYSLAKAAQEVKKRAIVRCAEFLRTSRQKIVDTSFAPGVTIWLPKYEEKSRKP